MSSSYNRVIPVRPQPQWLFFLAFLEENRGHILEFYLSPTGPVVWRNRAFASRDRSAGQLDVAASELTDNVEHLSVSTSLLTTEGAFSLYRNIVLAECWDAGLKVIL